MVPTSKVFRLNCQLFNCSLPVSDVNNRFICLPVDDSSVTISAAATYRSITQNVHEGLTTKHIKRNYATTLRMY